MPSKITDEEHRVIDIVKNGMLNGDDVNKIVADVKKSWDASNKHINTGYINGRT